MAVIHPVIIPELKLLSFPNFLFTELPSINPANAKPNISLIKSLLF